VGEHMIDLPCIDLAALLVVTGGQQMIGRDTSEQLLPPRKGPPVLDIAGGQTGDPTRCELPPQWP